MRFHDKGKRLRMFYWFDFTPPICTISLKSTFFQWVFFFSLSTALWQSVRVFKSLKRCSSIVFKLLRLDMSIHSGITPVQTKQCSNGNVVSERPSLAIPNGPFIHSHEYVAIRLSVGVHLFLKGVSIMVFELRQYKRISRLVFWSTLVSIHRSCLFTHFCIFQPQTDTRMVQLRSTDSTSETRPVQISLWSLKSRIVGYF